MRELSSEQRGPVLAAWRRTCAHVSGGAMGSTVSVLERHGVIDRLAAASAPAAIDALAERCGLDRAYAQLAALLLATQGLATCDDPGTRAATIVATPDGREWARHAAAYDSFELVLDQAARLRSALRDDTAAPQIGAPGASARARHALAGAPDELRERLRRHLRGPLVGAAVQGLASVRGFARIARAPLGWCPLDALPLPRAALEACVVLLAEEGWLQRDDDLIRLTPQGRIGAGWSPLYGYLVGYLGVLGQVPSLLGRERPPEGDATTVKSDADRELLLAGKAQVFAHGGLRAPLEEMVRAVFDAEPLAAQPRVLFDMSAGDGSVLVALHGMIAERSRRGAVLDAHPLALVGLVGSEVARTRAAERLAAAGIEALLLAAPIEDPDAVAAELARAGLDLQDALVVSKTCVHGRRLRGTVGVDLPALDGAPSCAVFVTPEGTLVPPATLEDDLAAFFARWAAFLGRHGMVVADAHTVAPEIAAASWEVSVVTHVCATHGYSAQYLVEATAFRRAARRGGFATHASRDLGSELVGATTMTLDHLMVDGSRS